MTGCGIPGPAQPEAQPPNPQPSGVDPDVLAAWKTFPVTRQPRPIVLIGSLPWVSFGTGYGKLATYSGNFALATTLPEPTTDTADVALPDGVTRLALTPARQAYDALIHHPDLRHPSAGTAAGTPLMITRVALGEATFRTDRGDIELPAWRFSTADDSATMAWPALTPSAFWSPGAARQGVGAYPPTFHTGSAHGRTVTVTFNLPADPCPGEPVYRYDPVAVESSTAVAVGLRAVQVSAGTPGRFSGCVQDAMLRTTSRTLTLAQPLGDRVLVGDTGDPVSVA